MPFLGPLAFGGQDLIPRKLLRCPDGTVGGPAGSDRTGRLRGGGGGASKGRGWGSRGAGRLPVRPDLPEAPRPRGKQRRERQSSGKHTQTEAFSPSNRTGGTSSRVLSDGACLLPAGLKLRPPPESWTLRTWPRPSARALPP